MTYPVTTHMRKQPLLPEYRLTLNPFRDVEAPGTEVSDPLGSFWRYAAYTEANRVWWALVDRVEGDHSPLWLVRDENATGLANIGTITILLRRLASDPLTNFLSLYLPLPLAYEDLTRAILRVLADRIVPVDLRRCFYAFAARQVEEAIASGRAGDELSLFDDVNELAEKLRQPKESRVGRFLLPTRNQQVEQRHRMRQMDIERAEATERQDQEAVDAIDAERQQMLDEAEQRRQLLAFLERSLHDANYGEALNLAMRRAFETSAFSQALDPLAEAADHRQSLSGLLRFLRHRFSQTLVFVDQVEAFGAFTDEEKARFYGALAEFGALAAGNAFWVFASMPDTIDQIGKRRLALFVNRPMSPATSSGVSSSFFPWQV